MTTKDPIHFECPRCGSTHDRGYFNGVDTFRCFPCGYMGHGFHPEKEFDEAIAQELRENAEMDKAAGLPLRPFTPETLPGERP